MSKWWRDLDTGMIYDLPYEELPAHVLRAVPADEEAEEILRADQEDGAPEQVCEEPAKETGPPGRVPFDVFCSRYEVTEGERRELRELLAFLRFREVFAWLEADDG